MYLVVCLLVPFYRADHNSGYVLPVSLPTQILLLLSENNIVFFVNANIGCVFSPCRYL